MAHQTTLTANVVSQPNWIVILYFALLPTLALAIVEIAAHRAMHWTYETRLAGQIVWLAPLGFLIYAFNAYRNLKAEKKINAAYGLGSFTGSYLAVAMTLISLAHR